MLTEHSAIEEYPGKDCIFWGKKKINNEGEVLVPLKLMRKVNPKWSGE